MGRAGRLLRGEDDPLAGWVWMTAAYVSADLAEAVRLCERALGVARAQGDADLELCSLSGLGEKLVMAGQIERGLALIDEAMAGTLGGERSRLDTVAYTCCDMLVACDLAADLERARQWCQVADRFIAAYGCPFLYARCRTLYGSVLVATGHWAAGERELLRAVEMCAGAGPAVASDAYARLADLRLRQGRLEEAARLLRGREEEPRASVAVAALRLAQGDPPGATALLRRHLRQVADGHLAAAPALALLVRAGLAQGDVAQARLAAGRLSALAAGQRSPYTAALAAEAEGQVSLAAGDRRLGWSAWRPRWPASPPWGCRTRRRGPGWTWPGPCPAPGRRPPWRKRRRRWRRSSASAPAPGPTPPRRSCGASARPPAPPAGTAGGTGVT